MEIAFNVQPVSVKGPDSTAGAAHGDAALDEGLLHSWPEESAEEGIFLLPGGFVADDQTINREVELKPVTGKEEEFLASLHTNIFTSSVVTGLLRRCIKRVGSLPQINRSVIKDMLVGDRDYLIIKLREMTWGKKIEAVMRCPHPDCGKPMDILFSTDDFPIERKEVSSRFFAMQLSADAAYRDGGEIGGQPVEFRLPTGADMERLAPLVCADETRAINRLLACCVRRIGELTRIDETLIARLSDSTRLEIEEEIAQRAPQVAIEMEMACPECRHCFDTRFDFTAFFLAEMKSNLRHLHREVHLLAWHYHWSEQEIMSMTRKKRKHYVMLLQEEIDRLNYS